MRWLHLVCGLALLTACQNEPSSAYPGIVDDGLPVSLTGNSGDPISGQAVFQSREGGHCVLCHRIEGLTAEFQGDLGPDLTFVGDRLSPEQIRLRIVDYEQLQSGVTMPSYFRIHDLNQVGEEYQGQTILTAQQVEDLVAYLSERKDDL